MITIAEPIRKVDFKILNMFEINKQAEEHHQEIHRKSKCPVVRILTDYNNKIA